MCVQHTHGVCGACEHSGMDHARRGENMVRSIAPKYLGRGSIPNVDMQHARSGACQMLSLQDMYYARCGGAFCMQSIPDGDHSRRWNMPDVEPDRFAACQVCVCIGVEHAKCGHTRC